MGRSSKDLHSCLVRSFVSAHRLQAWESGGNKIPALAAGSCGRARPCAQLFYASFLPTTSCLLVTLSPPHAQTGLLYAKGSSVFGLHVVCRYAILCSLRHACGGVRVLGRNWHSKRAHAGVAQLVEHLICNQRVGGSSPFASSKIRASASFLRK